MCRAHPPHALRTFLHVYYSFQRRSSSSCSAYLIARLLIFPMPLILLMLCVPYCTSLIISNAAHPPQALRTLMHVSYSFQRRSSSSCSAYLNARMQADKVEMAETHYSHVAVLNSQASAKIYKQVQNTQASAKVYRQVQNTQASAKMVQTLSFMVQMLSFMV